MLIENPVDHYWKSMGLQTLYQILEIQPEKSNVFLKGKGKVRDLDLDIQT